MSEESQGVDPILYIVKGIKHDQLEVNATLRTMSANLGGINSTLQSMASENIVQNKRIYELEKAHNSCEARLSVRSLHKRVSDIESDYKTDLKERADASGRIDVAAQRAEALAMAPKSSSMLGKEILVKTLPWLIAAAISGAAIGGGYVAQVKAGESAVKADSASKK